MPNTDAAVVHQKRWDAVLDDEFLQEAPALVVEVHSPANTKAKLLRKVELYLEHGAEQCWVIYPEERKVTIFFPDGTNDQRREGDTLSFHGCDIGVNGLFA